MSVGNIDAIKCYKIASEKQRPVGSIDAIKCYKIASKKKGSKAQG